MFRRPRETEPDRFSKRLSETLQPLTVIPWGGLAMCYLGVPIAIGASMVVVQDNDYTAAIEKLEGAGFNRNVPNRTPAPEIMENHPNPQQMMEEINAGYQRLDQSCAVFDYPQGDPEKGLQLYLFPNSFAHIFRDEIPRFSVEIRDTERFETYGNLHYPLEQALVESFVKAAIDEETNTGFSAWGESLRAWVSLMTGYLEVDNDIIDHCPDKQAVEWYSHNFGRIHEANFGPIDRRVTKRLGSGKEMPVDMRGNPI
ncbi:hypothetical protein BDV32DRAFT_139962 [Aspergillus pseudonomiae]|uniref:Uncharacterized protein n=1 Tax=Aspergillus pseudonomiae TaxID=1506151 RepID=A0A5N6HVU4_9EURO|nr:uncharacterized protein BDV37DRAFT_276677 [Aspergillus pseudonomiae]KAB8257984.1 hypothetical protein BDV32DRAFT_139962 [Aspergillus pseudonomiae]KAE8397771.1 hypothetical protein BDV37DRAFT_276677 [Aspergillus pseudonomiae]